MNTSSEEIYHGWKSSSCQERSTLDLLYGCCFTIFLCCWSAVHLHVPADGDTKFTILFRRIRWTMLCLLAPELILWLAVVDLCKARLLQREFQKIPTVSSWTIDHGFVLTMGGFTLKTPSGDRFRPSIQRFLDLLKSDEIEGLEIAKEDIEDKAIANAMIKLLAVLQILWFACNVIGRAVQHLPITTLELFTCAIIFCSLLTYMCWWYKPYDFERPFCLKTTASIGELEEATKKGQYYKYGHVSPGKRSPLLEVELDLLITTWQGSLTMWTVGAAVALSFGPWHLLGWNFYFNTEAERFLWQLCSLCCIALPFVIALIPLIELVEGQLVAKDEQARRFRRRIQPQA